MKSWIHKNGEHVLSLHTNFSMSVTQPIIPPFIHWRALHSSCHSDFYRVCVWGRCREGRYCRMPHYWSRVGLGKQPQYLCFPCNTKQDVCCRNEQTTYRSMHQIQAGMSAWTTTHTTALGLVRELVIHTDTRHSSSEIHLHFDDQEWGKWIFHIWGGIICGDGDRLGMLLQGFYKCTMRWMCLFSMNTTQECLPVSTDPHVMYILLKHDLNLSRRL